MRHHLEQIQNERRYSTRDGATFPTSGASSPTPNKHEYGLVIDGKTLAFALDSDLEKLFLLLAGKCNSVICCRSSPIQKVIVSLECFSDSLHYILGWRMYGIIKVDKDVYKLV